MNATLVAMSSSANSRLISELLDNKMSFTTVVVCGLNRLTIKEDLLHTLLPKLGHFTVSYSHIRASKYKVMVY